MKDIEENSNSSSNELSLEEIDRMVAEKQNMSISEINDEVRQLENDIKVKRIEIQGLPSDALNLTINKRRNSIVTELFKERPWLIANIEQVLDKSSENDEFEDPAESMMNSPSNDKLVVLKLSIRWNVYAEVTYPTCRTIIELSISDFQKNEHRTSRRRGQNEEENEGLSLPRRRIWYECITMFFCCTPIDCFIVFLVQLMAAL